MQRVWPINRFLDWLAKRELIASNPLEDLRKDLGTRDTAQIVRALLSSDSAAALDALRPIPRFASQLGSGDAELRFPQAVIGFSLPHPGVSVASSRPVSAGVSPILLNGRFPSIIEAWGKRNPTPQHLLECAQSGRILARASAAHRPNRHPATSGPAFEPASPAESAPAVYLFGIGYDSAAENGIIFPLTRGAGAAV